MPATPYSEAEVRRWLSFLARSMQRRGESIFLLEQLQPGWVDDARLRAMFNVVTFLIPVAGHYFLLALAAVLALLAMPESYISVNQTNSLVPVVVIVTLPFYLIPVLPLWIAISRARRSPNERIRTVERVGWSFDACWEPLRTRRWRAVGCLALIIWPLGPILLPIVLVRCAIAGIRPFKMDLKTAPNQGILLTWRTARRILFPCVLVTAAVALTSYASYQLAFGVLALHALSHPATRFGLLDVIEHYFLRWILKLHGDAPLDYARFLDYAANQLRFLQKVGGGYMFMHRSLLEYFASQEKTQA